MDQISKCVWIYENQNEDRRKQLMFECLDVQLENKSNN